MLVNDVRGPTAIKSPTVNLPVPSPICCKAICNVPDPEPAAVDIIVELAPFACILVGSA